MDVNVLLFVLGIISYQVLKMLYLIAKRAIGERREKKFIKRLSIIHPDSTIQVISVEASDKKALQDLERQLRGEDKDSSGNRRGDRNSRRSAPHGSEDPQR